MLRAIVKVSPAAIRWKLSADLTRGRLDPVRWQTERLPLDPTDKYASIRQRYLDGRPWEETPLFTQIYATRIARGETVRGSQTMSDLVAQYYGRVDAMFAFMRQHGYRNVVDGREVKPIPVCVDGDNEILIGNQGNHRLAMAKVLELPAVTVEVMARHPESQRTDEPDDYWCKGPDLPECAQAIPAMTTEAERQCYYRLTRVCASQGAVVELGAWLGAASAYIAAGMRDAGSAKKAHVYDRFVWKPAHHDKKAGGPIGMSQLEAFRKNLGPLLDHVEVHPGEVTKLQWRGGSVSLLVCDAPKRIAEIASVLGTLARVLRVGSLMAWQDFAYFPSYDIPAALIRLGDRVGFTEAVYPGTTAVFRVHKTWTPAEVSASALSLRTWTPDEVEAAWDDWGARLPEPMRPRFACGAAMFLCDLGATERAQRKLAAIIEAHPDEVLPKWRYLLEERAALMQRYQPLVEAVQLCA